MRERGQAVFALLFILVIGGATAFYTFYSPTNARIQREKVTIEAMAGAKTALVGWATVARYKAWSAPMP